MRRISKLLLSTIAAALWLSLLMVGWSFVAADTANVPSLTISQLKITSSNGQFITLYNATNTTLDMSKYQLQYFNSYDTAKATSSRLIALSGTVPPHGYFMINDSSLLLCYQLTIDSVSLGLSSTAGFIQVLALSQSTPGAPVVPTLQDYIGWTKTAVAGAQTLPANTGAFLQRQPADSHNNPLVVAPGAGSWQSVQPDAANACDLVTGSGSLPVPTGPGQLLPASAAPASIVSLSSEDPATLMPSTTLPAADIGLMKPQITELLPNPDGTGNDTTDEYIELYNSNDANFDLTGFALQAGTTRPRKYTFLSDTVLPPRSFTAFYSETTGLNMSNTGSQVKLLDPGGSPIAQTDAYKNAKDGQAWALANGKWYWTTTSTPSLANVINQPLAAKKKAVAPKTKTGKADPGKVSSKTNKTGKTKLATSASTEAPSTTPIHLGALALIAGLALLYGAYEYRADIKNRIYQLKSYFSYRRADRP